VVPVAGAERFGELWRAGRGWPGITRCADASVWCAVACKPEDDLERTRKTLELDHVIGAVFGLWDVVLPEERLFKKPAQMQLPMPGLKSVRPNEPDGKKRVG
jgi:hypothetical protein